MRLIDADALPRHGNRGGLVHWKDIKDAPTIDPTELGFVKADEILEDVKKTQYWIDRYQAPRFDISIAVRRAVKALIEKQTGERYHEENKDE